MRNMSQAVLLLMAGALLICGCSSGGFAPPAVGPAPAEPDSPLSETDNRGTDTRHGLWGMWRIQFDLTDMSFDIEPERNLEAHFDVTDMLLPPNCDDCVGISVNSFDPVTRILDADVTLRNPHKISGYDVRGILYTNDYGHELRNADDWTGLWDIPGGGTINPFKAFAKAEANRKFAGEAEHMENYLVYIPVPPHYAAIRFAVDASWPSNCKEPYSIEDFTHDVLYDVSGYSAEAQISVYDWQDDVDEVTLAAPEITGEAFTQFYQFQDEIWKVQLVNNASAPAGDYTGQIITSSPGPDIPLYDYVTITVTEAPAPVVTSIFPDTGSGGLVFLDVEITGDNFCDPGSAVRLLPPLGVAIEATNEVVVDENSMTCDIAIPGGSIPGLYDVEVTNCYGKVGVGVDLFEVTPSGCTVTGITPDSAEIFTSLDDAVIEGVGFADGPMLGAKLVPEYGDEIVVTDVTYVSSTLLTCDFYIFEYADQGLYDVEVTNGDGSTCIGEDLFEVFAPVPFITYVNPDSGEAGEALIGVVISGDNFYGPEVGVSLIPPEGFPIWGQVISVYEPDTIICNLSLPWNGVISSYDVEVINIFGQPGWGMDFFDVLCPTPVVDSTLPESGEVGETISDFMITGVKFWGPGAEVRLKLTGEPDIVATNVDALGPNTITCEVAIPIDAELGFYDVMVTNGCGEFNVTTELFEVKASG